MEYITILLEKLENLNNQHPKTTIDYDVMMDITRELYSRLLDLRQTRMDMIIKPEMPETIIVENVTPPETIARIIIPEPAEEEVVEIQQTDTATVEIHNHSETEASVVEVPKYDFRTKISINERFLFMRQLFAGDIDAYEHAITQISAMKDIFTAKRWLHENVHFPYGWEEDDETVKSFYVLLSQFFRSR